MPLKVDYQLFQCDKKKKKKVELDKNLPNEAVIVGGHWQNFSTVAYLKRQDINLA